MNDRPNTRKLKKVYKDSKLVMLALDEWNSYISINSKTGKPAVYCSFIHIEFKYS